MHHVPADLRVVDPEAIGQILSCPKCGSMVLVEPPPGRARPDTAPPWQRSTSNSAVKMSAATVTESPQPLMRIAAGSVEDASEAVPAPVLLLSGKLMST